ncbi:aspartate dehydrogenase [Roseburia sp. 1XD42-69]|uniref:aspartate dehydrogenase n=1 Tax=Roseburia sp. 1XD42-69 TaxID=2320088 RepID=UPI000EA24D85|nr:aspartate dehydrogenase [Roseburia sp. 1XD42-69]RKJ65695.1 aspartate dehydrogenase [Roseburia sp. 1XD42-69]
MFFKREKKAEGLEEKSFDREKQIPVLRCSICNGEQVAGFKDRETGKFHEAAFIRNEKELKEFMEIYGIEKITKEY